MRNNGSFSLRTSDVQYFLVALKDSLHKSIATKNVFIFTIIASFMFLILPIFVYGPNENIFCNGNIIISIGTSDNDCRIPTSKFWDSFWGVVLGDKSNTLATWIAVFIAIYFTTKDWRSRKHQEEYTKYIKEQKIELGRLSLKFEDHINSFIVAEALNLMDDYNTLKSCKIQTVVDFELQNLTDDDYTLKRCKIQFGDGIFNHIAKIINLPKNQRSLLSLTMFREFPKMIDMTCTFLTSNDQYDEGYIGSQIVSIKDLNTAKDILEDCKAIFDCAKGNKECTLVITLHNKLTDSLIERTFKKDFTITNEQQHIDKLEQIINDKINLVKKELTRRGR